jgi:hypothetical protein
MVVPDLTSSGVDSGTNGYLERFKEGLKTVYGLNSYKCGYNRVIDLKNATSKGTLAIKALDLPINGAWRTIYPVASTFGTLAAAEYAIYNYVPAVQVIFSDFPEDDLSRQIFAIGFASTFLVSLLACAISGTRYLQGMDAGFESLEEEIKPGKNTKLPREGRN